MNSVQQARRDNFLPIRSLRFLGESHLSDSDLFFICTDVEKLQLWIPKCPAKNAAEIMAYRECLTIETFISDLEASA